MQRLLVFLLLPIMACSGLRKLESSASRAPDWLYGIEQNYVITFGVGDTHEEARNLAISKVKEEIIKSVAVQVTYEEELTTQEDVNSFFQDFESSTTMASDYFEPIKGISPNEVEAFYWEEIRENGTIRIRYHIKYPFPQTELNALIADYDRINAGWEAELRKVTSKSSYPRAEDLFADIDQLTYLSNKLPNQKSREARERKRLLEEMASEIKLTLLENSPGRIRYQLSLYGKPIATDEKPDIRFSCALNIDRVKSFEDQVIIEYEVVNCPPAEEQIIAVQYDLDGYRARGIFSILQD